MRPALLLLLGLGLGLRCGGLPPPPATRGARAGVSIRAPGAPAAAPGGSPPAWPRLPAPGQAAALRSVADAQGLPPLRGRARLGLRPRVALGGGVLSGSDRGPAWRPRWHCLHVRVLLRALRARRAVPTRVDPRSLRRPAPLRRLLWPRERTLHLGLVSPTDASSASRGLHPDAGFETQTKCLTDVNSGSWPAGESAVSCRFSRQVTCSIKKVQINRNPGLPAVLLTRRMDISLNATFQYDCPMAHTVQSNWKVFSVQSLHHQPDWTKPLVVPGFQLGNDPTVMHIPKKTLSLGVYVFNFSVILVPSLPQAAVDKGSDSIHILILSDFLQAVLLGEVNVTIKFTDQLVLNGSTSMDPDVDDPLEGVQFSWFCTTNSKNYNGDKINVISKEVCLPKQVDLKLTWASDPVLTISPETLRGGHVYFFRMVIQKAPRSAYSDKRVHVLQAPAPKASILCIENCGRILVLSDRFSLALNCPDCARSREVYKWSILRASGDEVTFDWLGQTSTGRDSDSLSIKTFAFRNFPEAQFWIALDLETWGGANLNLRHSFTVNYAPAIGDCKINPTSGIAFFTKFVVQCNNFKDQNIPLTYKMIVSDLYDGFGEISSLTENTLGPILYVGNDHKCPPSFLPVGGGDGHYSLKVFVQVYDSLAAFSQVTFYANVQAPTGQASPQAILKQLVNFTVGQNSEISTLLQKQEFLFAGYLMYVVASVLNSMKPEPALQADKAWLREHLVNQSSLLPMNTLMEINQVVTTFAKLTQRTSEFPQVARQSATERMWQANRAFQQHQQKGRSLHSEQIEIISTGILTSVSNILKMTDPHVISVDPFRVIQSLADTILAGKVPDDESTVMSSAGFTMYASKMEKWAVSNNMLGNERRCRNCFQPTLNVSSIPRLAANAPVSVVFCEFADDPFPWLNYQDSLAADVVGFRLTGIAANGDELEVTPDVVDVYVSRRNLSSAAFNLTVGPDHEPDNTDESSRMTTGAFRFEVDSHAVRELLVHIVTEVTVQFTVLVYAGGQITPSALVATFLVPHGIPPIANQSGLFDPACAVSVPRLVCLPLSLLQVIAQRGHSPESVIIVVLKAPHFVMQPSDKLVRISLFSVRCLDMYGVQSDWTEDTCVLGEKTTWDRVHCVCRKARRARRQLANIPLHFRYLTAKVIVPPNPVDLRLEVIKKVTQNPVTLFVVLFILVTYIVLAFWALHRDETDQYLRDHAIVLPDNDPYDNICYLVTFFTGSRCGSGTRANVFVQLTGTQGTSDVHCLSHPHFKTLFQGSVHTFLLTTSRDLGDIQSIRVWHNNEGHAPGWYLSRVKVENLFSRHIWLFMCREWLSIETSLDRTFPVTDPNTPLQRMDFLLIDATDNLGKNHLWFSVFAGVIARGFNRLQRLSCCLAMLLSTLLCNIMFFNLDTEKQDKQDQGNRYVRSMIIGLESVMITLPVQVIITGLFTYSQRRPQATLDKVTPQEYPEVAEESGHWEERLERWHAQEIAAEARSQEADAQEARAQEMAAEARFREADAQEAHAQEMAAEARFQEADAQEARAQEMAAEARFQEADAQEARGQETAVEARSQEADDQEARAQEARAQEMAAETRSQETSSEEAHAQEARSQEARSKKKRSQKVRSLRARSLKARSLRARSLRARSLRARSQEARAQEARSQKEPSQKVRSQRAHSQEAHAQERRSQKERSLKVRSLRGRSQRAHSQEAHAQERRSQKERSLKVRSLRGRSQRARSQRARSQEAHAQEMAAEARSQEARSQKERSLRARSQRARSQRARSQRARSQEAHAQERAAEARSQEAHAQEARSQKVRSQKVRSLRGRSQRARSQRAHSQEAHAQEMAAEARSQEARSQKERSLRARSQRARSQRARSQEAHAQERAAEARSQEAHAQEARSQKERSQKVRSLRGRSQRARSQRARSQEAHAQEPATEAHSQEPRAQESRSQKASARKTQQSLTRKLTGRHKSLSKRTSKAGHSLRKKDSEGPHTPGTNTNANANANNENMNNSPQVPSAQPPPPDQEPGDPLAPPPPPTKPRTTLPGWWKWVAWFLVFATSGVSSFFIVFYGLTYGYEKSIEWLFASLCSFCESVFLVQPSKIILLTGMRTNRLKYCKNLSWVSNYRYTEIQLQDLRLRPEEMHQRHQDVARLRGSSMYQPLTQDEVGIFRRKRALKRRAQLFLGHFLTHCIFLALLLGLVALLRRTDSFRYNQFIRSRFSVDLATVTKLDDIYPWLHSALLPLLHNDLHPTFLPDSSSKILGLPLLRQVRATPGPKACRPAKRFPPNSIEGEVRCHPEYGADPEDTSDHPGFWKKVAKREADKNTNGFTYKPPEERWVYYSYGLLHTYGSGGYVFYFFPDQQQFNSTLRLRDLQSGRWLDEKTWAVILELTTLNADAGLLSSTSVLFEVSQLGVVNASISVHSFSLADLNRDTSAEIYLYVAILAFFVAYVVYEGYVITQKGASYLANANNLFNLALKCTLAVLIALFLRKHFLATGIIQFYSSNPVDFIPFHAVAQVDRALGIVLGLLLFLTILKTLGYFRFFYHVRLAERVLQTALPGICHVALLVFVYFFLFVAFGHLVFGQHEWGYSTLTRATQTVFAYCTAALRDAEFSSNRALGVLLLAAFVLLLICVLIHLFTAVILSAYKALRQPVYEEPSGEAEAIAYLCGKLRTVFGFLCCQPKAQEQRELFMDMLYGKPERHSSHYLGLKTRNINEKKMVYLVV